MQLFPHAERFFRQSLWATILVLGLLPSGGPAFSAES